MNNLPLGFWIAVAATLSLPSLGLGEPVTETVEIRRPLHPDGTFALENTNGSITVEGWEEPEVRVVAVKSAPTAEDLAALSIDVQSSPDRFALTTRTRARESNWWSMLTGGGRQVRYQVQIPAGARIERIACTNGSVEISGVRGAVKVETTNGSIRLAGTPERAELGSVNGAIRAHDLTSEGRIETTNGAIDVRLGRMLSTGKLRLETVNGSVRIALPPDAQADLRAETVNGTIRNEFGFPEPRRAAGGREFQVRLGMGGPLLLAETVNGSIRFVKQ